MVTKLTTLFEVLNRLDCQNFREFCSKCQNPTEKMMKMNNGFTVLLVVLC